MLWCPNLTKSRFCFFSWNLHEGFYPTGGLFASVGQMGVGFGVSPNTSNPTNNSVNVSGTDLYMKYVSPEVIRVAPSKAIELFAYDTAKKALTPKDGEQPKLPLPPSFVAGAVAGVSSTLCTYPLELLTTRLTIQRDVYDNLLHALLKIIQEEGPSELYRGLTPSLIGVVPYAATNYFAYVTLKKLYKKTFNTDDIGNVATLLIGSAAGAISSSATFPLEVARKHMQVGAVGGR
ncbi:unnamed protein product [Musa hybrid cultivar]